MQRRLPIGLLPLVVLLIAVGCPTTPPDYTPPPPPPTASNSPDIMFVTQTPLSADFANIVSTFGNHRANTGRAPRGGDLYVRYSDGSLRNVTQDLGYGVNAGEEITVRDPHVHWDGDKALFSMVVGGTTKNDYTPVYFQIYEVTGVGQGETAQIRKLAQPDDYNNIAPCYGTDNRIIFTSDRPRNGDRDLYPQLDEYESTPTVSGLWVMNADGMNLKILDHSPSGDFDPFVDSFGRVIFTRWDHFQRDQQADGDIVSIINGGNGSYDVVTYNSEDSDTNHPLAPGDETFPEQRGQYGQNAPDPTWDDMQATENGHRFNVFFPWMIHEDGAELETLNHIGRLELSSYIPSARNYLPEAYSFPTPRIQNFMQICESPTRPGYYYAVNCPEFFTHSAGQVVGLNGPPGMNPDDMAINYITHEETADAIDDSDSRPNGHSGLFRDPLAASDGSLWAVHSDSPYEDASTIADPGSPAPRPYSSRYNFNIRQLVPGGPNGAMVPGLRLTNPITKSIQYFDNYSYHIVSYNGPMWELQPVEIASRPRPSARTAEIPSIEQNMLLTQLGGQSGLDALRAYLETNALALVISRDVTQRADEQQDINLKIHWSSHETAESGSTPKEIAWMQFYEGLQLRGYRWDGRRIIARPIDDALNPAETGAPEGAVKLGDDGSMAAFVPAERALSWQSTEHNGDGAVRERYWVTFKAGEIRVCANCHGINNTDVFGQATPTNEPQALTRLLDWWKTAP